MCDPITILTAISTGFGIKQASDARKDRKQEAARQRQAAEQEQSEADKRTRDERKTNYASRASRRTEARTGRTSGFTPRSFFA